MLVLCSVFALALVQSPSLDQLTPDKSPTLPELYLCRLWNSRCLPPSRAGRSAKVCVEKKGVEEKLWEQERGLLSSLQGPM